MDEISNVTPSYWANAFHHVQKLEEFVFQEELKIDPRQGWHFKGCIVSGLNPLK